jgi:hypothetical protein
MNASPCDGFAAARVDAAEGTISPELARHLEGCVACMREVAALRSDLAALAPEPAPVPGPWLARNIRRAAEARRQGRRSRLVVFGPVAAAAAGLVLIVVAATGGGQIRAPADPSRTVAEAEAAPAAEAAGAAVEAWDLEGFDLDWDAGWGTGMDVVLAGADTAALERLAERLPQ